MTEFVNRKIMTGVLAGLMLLLIQGNGARACEKVPPEYQKRKNPVTLTESRISYFRKQFQSRCALCHGKDGKGGGEEAGKMAFPPVNLTDSKFMGACSDGQIYYQIEKGGEEKSAMPAFGPDSDAGWSESKIWGMVAYVRTLVN